MMDFKIIKQLPKVLLHDHLDGGLRAETIIQLAEECKYTELPTNNSLHLKKWFYDNSNSGSLSRYLDGFKHTIAVMQTKDALERVAFEMIEDMYNDNVVYVETRFSPLLHTKNGLSAEECILSVLKGLRKGREIFNVGYGLILCGIRNIPETVETTAELAIKFKNCGVVGFDLAGQETGNLPKKYKKVFKKVKKSSCNITIHAGEVTNQKSIRQAIQLCNTDRIGHGTKLTKLGTELDDFSMYVLNKRIPIEVCLSSNVHTGSIDKIVNHPFNLLYKEGFCVTLNTDNRLMSDTTMSNEFIIANKYFNLDILDFEQITINAMEASFLNYKEKLDYINNIIKPIYRNLYHD